MRARGARNAMSEGTEPKSLDVSVRLAKTYDATLLQRELEALLRDYNILPQPGVDHAGELWYGDFSCFHSVENRSDITRYHLVMDVGVNDFVLSLFPPDFAKHAKLRPLKIYEPALKLSRAELQSYECEFDIPPTIMQF